MSGDAPLTLGMVAGEPSGDVLAGSVLRGLAERVGAVDGAGIGGPAMAARGFRNWWGIDALSVNGYVEVLRAYPRLKRMRDQLRERLIDWHPDLFVGVDAPDFNLDLEIALREKGIRVAHFISPSIWAWRKERIHKIRRAVDHMLLVFPFEQAIYDQAGIPASYVGHPLADAIPLAVDVQGARQALGLTGSGQVVALLPGSRGAEISHLAQDFLQTARWLAQRRPDLQFVLPAANEVIYQRLRQLLATSASLSSLRLTLTQGRSHLALAAADTVLVASGTATLEAALFGKPMVIAYRLSWLNYRIMRNKGYLPWIGLPNILCDDTVVPEFVQHAVTPPTMGQALLGQLEQPAERQRIAERFQALHARLRCDCASRSAEVLASLARQRPGA